MKIERSVVLGSVLGLLSSCVVYSQPAAECGVNGCTTPRTNGGVICTSDANCDNGICGADGLCTQPQNCTVTSSCPLDMYCNTALPLPLCTALPAGACREASQCNGGVCSAVAGGVGKCVECLTSSDCASGSCNVDGTCAAQSSTSTPEPTSNDCPANSHIDGDGCACDTGYELDASGTSCVPASNTTPTGGGEDPCDLSGRYDDGTCDTDCWETDPDCNSTPSTGTDYCEEYGYYGDGECDEYCPQPDPDCSSTGGATVGGDCGNVTDYGACQGNTVVWCEGGVLKAIDCSDQGAYCELYSEDEGYFCITYE